MAEKAWRWKDLRIKTLNMLRESLKIVWVGRSENVRIFFLSNVWTKKSDGVIYQDVMKRVSGGAHISLPCGSVFGFKKQHWATFSSPLWTCIVNSTRTNFSPHWKKCSLSCRSVFGLKKHWDSFFFCLEKRMHFESIGTRFSAPVVLFLPKSNTGKRCSCGCFFLAWSSTGQGVKLRRSQVERARSLQDEKKKLKNCWWEFRITNIKVRRFGHMRLCVSEGVRVWRWGNLQMGRGQNFIHKENEKEETTWKNWKYFVKNTHRKVTVCNFFYIFKKIQKKNNLIRQNDTRIHTFPRMPLEFLLRDISIFDTSMPRLPRLPRQELRRHDIKILVPTLPQEISSHGENWTWISFVSVPRDFI